MRNFLGRGAMKVNVLPLVQTIHLPALPDPGFIKGLGFVGGLTPN